MNPFKHNTEQIYRYDALDRLIEQQHSNQTPRRRFYQDDRLITEIGNEQQHAFFSTGGWLHAEHQQREAQSERILLGCDSQRSVLQTLDSRGAQAQVYNAYGQPAAVSGINSLLGFNGEAVDPLTGCYLLGNGYRAYNPGLMRFHSPDSWSPFDGGGLNAYAYCLGDPINRVDPTGHMSWQGLLGWGLAIGGMALSILALASVAAAPIGVAGIVAALGVIGAVTGAAASAVSIAQLTVGIMAPNKHTESILGYVSLGLGAVSLVAGIGASAISAASKVGNRLSQAAGKGLSGRGAGAAGKQIAAGKAAVAGEASGRSLQEMPDLVIKRLMTYLPGQDLSNLSRTSKHMDMIVKRNLPHIGITHTAPLDAPPSDLRVLRDIALGNKPGYLPGQVLNNPSYFNMAVSNQVPINLNHLSIDFWRETFSFRDLLRTRGIQVPRTFPS